MSDQIEQTPTEQPNAGAGQQAGLRQAQAPEQGAAGEPAEPQPFAVFKDAKSFSQRLARETRKALNESAKQAGFDDWQHMSDALDTIRRGSNVQTTTASSKDVQITPENPQEGQQATPAPTPAPVATDDAKRLRMALNVASDLNLPTALVTRLVGDTVDEMKADAERLLGLFQQPQRGPGIPSVPKPNQVVTFTRAQLSDPAFVRANKDAILQASREGRIVNS